MSGGGFLHRSASQPQNKERLLLSHLSSQSLADVSSLSFGMLASPERHRPASNGSDSGVGSPKDDVRVTVADSRDLISTIKEENEQLRRQLEENTHRMAQLSRFERELDAIRQQHDILQESTDKRDRLSQAIRAKLEERCRRIEHSNKQLKAQLEDERRLTSSSNLQARDDLLAELTRRDRLIHTLSAQCATGQDEAETLRRRVLVLQDQVSKIPSLEATLSASEDRLRRADEELQRQKAYCVRVREFETALVELKEANSKREAMENKLRARLQHEVDILRQQLQKASGGGVDNNSIYQSESSAIGLTAQQLSDFEALLCRREERIHQLEEEAQKWHHLYLEEMTGLQQSSLNADLAARDGRIVALEHSAVENEGMAVELQQQIMKSREELYLANRQVVELEANIKSFQLLLAEKDEELRRLRLESETLGGRQPSLQSLQSGPLTPISRASNSRSGSVSSLDQERGPSKLEERLHQLDLESDDHISSSSC